MRAVTHKQEERKQNDKFATIKKKKATAQIAHLVFADPQKTNLKKLKEQSISNPLSEI